MTEEKEGFIGECLKMNNLCAKLIIANNLVSGVAKDFSGGEG